MLVFYELNFRKIKIYFSGLGEGVGAQAIIFSILMQFVENNDKIIVKHTKRKLLRSRCMRLLLLIITTIHDLIMTGTCRINVDLGYLSLSNLNSIPNLNHKHLSLSNANTACFFR